MMKGYLHQARQRYTVWMTVLFLLIAQGVYMVNNNYGINVLSAGGLAVLIGFVVLSAVAALAIMVVDREVNNMKQFKQLFMTALVVLIVAALVTPISNFIRSLLPF